MSSLTPLIDQAVSTRSSFMSPSTSLIDQNIAIPSPPSASFMSLSTPLIDHTDTPSPPSGSFMSPSTPLIDQDTVTPSPPSGSFMPPSTPHIDLLTMSMSTLLPLSMSTLSPLHNALNLYNDNYFSLHYHNPSTSIKTSSSTISPMSLNDCLLTNRKILSVV